MRSDAEFVRQLREAVTAYLRSLDAWEDEYGKFYRIPGAGQRKLSPDLEDVHRAYVRAFEELAALAPAAQRLCMRYELRNPWPALLRSRPSTTAPQMLGASGVGRNERVAIGECLRQLESASDPITAAIPPQSPRGLLQKLREYFL